MHEGGKEWKCFTQAGKSDLESLILAGAFDVFNDDREMLLAMLEPLQGLAKKYWEQTCKIRNGSKRLINDDGTINFADFVLLSNNYGQPNRDWRGGDFNNDAITNFADFVILSNNYGQSVGPSAIVASSEELAFFAPSTASLVTQAAAVPEPLSLAILGVGVLAARLSRPRRSIKR